MLQLVFFFLGGGVLTESIQKQAAPTDKPDTSKPGFGQLKPVCWTQWFDRDDPSGSGDWETLTNLRNENPGKICPKPTDIEVVTLSGNSVVQTGEVIYKMDTTTGFVCKKNDQPDKKCEDYKVRFRCSHPYCDDEACWTQWFDRDDPSGTGDWETLTNLRNENPGKICPKPANIEVVTLSGNSVIQTGEVIYKMDTTTGFVCKKNDQPDKKCEDYKVRFRCSHPYCDDGACWTQWFDRDDPSGSGDWETLTNLRNENPGKICPKPADIEVETLSGNSVVQTGEVIYKMDTTTGFVCKKNDQPDKKCEDYKVRFRCSHPYCDDGVCWTRWFDRDDPSGTGDWETLTNLRNENPGKICPKPADIEVVTLSGNSVVQTGEVIYKMDTTTGFVCKKNDQPDKKCEDYKVRFSVLDAVV
ncbi:mucin-5B-like isoform X3 [Gouania willdenowi]|uniref:mucin-5B-like isoform X3 n=1 Tax=Gouania willdenowi TaxID=441366 RepID=UPI0010544A7D|nr:mucin-5B-like isoform X3 [Gouania willdenowi]